MKKVFSVEKYIERRRECGCDSKYIDLNVNTWGKDCDGLTEEEMLDKGYETYDGWMVEVEDEIL